VQCARILVRTQRSEVIRLEVRRLPGVVCEEIDCQVGVLDGYLLRILWALCDGVCDDFGDGDELLLLELSEEFGVVERLCFLDTLEEFASLVLGLVGLNQNNGIAIFLYPLVLEPITLSYARDILTENFL
jgi:hypothetical protein